MLTDILEGATVYIVTGYTDMRKQIDGLVALVQLEYRQEMNEESLFLLRTQVRPD